MKRSSSLGIKFLAIAFPASASCFPLAAQNASTYNGGNSSWNTGSNWSTGSVPTATTDAVFAPAVSAIAVTNSSGDVANALYFNGNAGTGGVTFSSGTITLGSTNNTAAPVAGFANFSWGIQNNDLSNGEIFNSAIKLNNGGTNTGTAVSGTLTFNGNVTGNVGGNQTLLITSPNSAFGATNLSTTANTTFKGGYATFGTGSVLSNVPALQILTGGVAPADAFGVLLTNAGNISSSTAVNLTGGKLNSSSGVAISAGQLSLGAGTNYVDAIGTVGTATFSSLGTVARGAIFDAQASKVTITGKTAANNVNNIVGGWAYIASIGGASNSGDFASYNGSGQLVALPVASYTFDNGSSNTVGTWSSAQNVSIGNSTTGTISFSETLTAATTTINSLRIGGAAAASTSAYTLDFNGNALVINSGGILIAPGATIAAAYSFTDGVGGASLTAGSASGYNLYIASVATSGSGTTAGLANGVAITDNGGNAVSVTYSSGKNSVFSATGANTYSGGTYINGAATVSYATSANLGASGSSVYMNGGTIALPGVAGSYSLASHPLVIGANGGIVTTGNVTGVNLDFGALSGTGPLYITPSGFSQTVNFTGPNTATGPTYLRQIGGNVSTWTVGLNASSGNAINGDLYLVKTSTSTLNLTYAKADQLNDASVIKFDTSGATNLNVNLNSFSDTMGGLIALSAPASTLGTTVTSTATGAAVLTLKTVNRSDVTNGLYTYNGVVSDGGTGKTLSIVKSGAANQVFGNVASKYTGSTTVSQGTLTFGANVISTTTRAVSGSAVIATDVITVTGSNFTAGDAVTLESGTMTGLTAGTVYYVINPTANTFQLSTTPGGSAIDLTTVGSSATFTGLGAFGATNSAIALTDGNTGANDVALLGNTAGTINQRAITVGNNGSGTVTIGGSNTSGTVTYTGNITANKGVTLQAATGGTVVFSTGTWTANNNPFQIGTAGNLGTVQLNNTLNTTGGVTVRNGTLAAGAAGAIGSNTTVTVNGGTWDVATFADTVNGVSLQSGSIIGSSGGVITSNTAYDMQSGSVSAVLNGAVGLNKTTSGTVTLTGANGYTGATSVSAGTLNVQNTLATSSVTVSGGNLNLSGSGTLGAGTVTSSGGVIDLGTKSISNTLGTLSGGGAVNNGTITNNSGIYSVQQGSIGANLAGTNGLTKTTGNTVTLSGNNGYSGITTISAGTLALVSSTSNNNIGSSSKIIVGDTGAATLDVSGISTVGGFQVQASQTLAGHGTVVGSTTFNANSILSPGNSAGTLTFANNLTLNNNTGGSLLFDLGTSSDKVMVNGLLTLNGQDFTSFTFDTSGGGFGAGTYVLFEDTSSTIAGSLGGVLTSTQFTGYDATLGFDVTGRELVLTVAVVPEPGTWAMMIGGMVVLFAIQRRRRNV